MAAYIVLGLVLPFLSAWLMGPRKIRETADQALVGVLWRNYLFRLGVSLASCFLVALLLAFVAMAMLDSG
jgi:hypothetical protein